MIQAISLGEEWFAGVQPVNDLVGINVFFGPNGTGKTTLSRLVGKQRTYRDCSVSWLNGRELKALVFNREFIKAHFDQSGQVPGIFTLGGDSVDAERKIARKQKELRALLDQRETQEKALVESRKRHTELVNNFGATCRDSLNDLGREVRDAFRGFLNDNAKLANEILRRHAAKRPTKTASERTLTELIRDWLVVSDNSAVLLKGVSGTFDYQGLQVICQDPIWDKVIVGSNHVAIAALIDRLQVSDWVSEGRAHLHDLDDKQCPFCQQEVQSSLAADLDAYFNETYAKDKARVQELCTNYRLVSENATKYAGEVLAATPGYFDSRLAVARLAAFVETNTSNLLRLDAKLTTLSTPIELEDVGPVGAMLATSLQEALNATAHHNTLVSNHGNSHALLRDETWYHLIFQRLQASLPPFVADRAGLDDTIAQQAKLTKQTDDMVDTVQKDLARLEAGMTSTAPSAAAINLLLNRSGFSSFSITPDSTGKRYAINRRNGSDALETLSDGERSLISFLYFFHLLAGSLSEKPITENCVVVFDDPVTSQDSSAMLLVAQLIRAVMHQWKAGTHVKQVLVLTHNAYFHTRVSHRLAEDFKPANIAYWALHRTATGTVIEKCATNPVQSYYKLLWDEVRRATSPSLPNTLRRILETYFELLGGQKLKDLQQHFSDPGEKAICDALVSWTHSGSHQIFDDVSYSYAPAQWTTVFRQIFDKAGHLPHYKMMMGEES